MNKLIFSGLVKTVTETPDPTSISFSLIKLLRQCSLCLWCIEVCASLCIWLAAAYRTENFAVFSSYNTRFLSLCGLFLSKSKNLPHLKVSYTDIAISCTLLLSLSLSLSLYIYIYHPCIRSCTHCK